MSCNYKKALISEVDYFLFLLSLRQVEQDLQDMYPKHLLNADQAPACALLLGIDRLYDCVQIIPGNNLVQLREMYLRLCLSTLSVKACEC